MPLYEYECEQCHRRTEKIQKFSDPELTVCPHCGGLLQRTITAPAFQFAGGGWYKDLYSSTKPAAGGDAAKPASTESPAGSSSSTPAASAPAATPSSSTPAASTTPSKS